MTDQQDDPAGAKSRVISEPIPALANVVVFGGDKLVGRTLELLLRSTVYNVRFLNETSLGALGSLDKVQLVILAPGVSAKCREAILALVNKTVDGRIPILELVRSSRIEEVGTEHFLLWPCRAEDLKQEIKALLLAGSEGTQDGRSSQIQQEEEVRGNDQGID